MQTDALKAISSPKDLIITCIKRALEERKKQQHAAKEIIENYVKTPQESPQKPSLKALFVIVMLSFTLML